MKRNNDLERAKQILANPYEWQGWHVPLLERVKKTNPEIFEKQPKVKPIKVKAVVKPVRAKSPVISYPSWVKTAGDAKRYEQSLFEGPDDPDLEQYR